MRISICNLQGDAVSDRGVRRAADSYSDGSQLHLQLVEQHQQQLPIMSSTSPHNMLSTTVHQPLQHLSMQPVFMPPTFSSYPREQPSMGPLSRSRLPTEDVSTIQVVSYIFISGMLFPGQLATTCRVGHSKCCLQLGNQ